MSTATYETADRPVRISPLQRLWRRELEHYPNDGYRYFMLGVVVLSTVILYYENYIGGAVATQLLDDLNMSFGYYVKVLVVANGVGAAASLAAGLADRVGRANLVAFGLLFTGLITLFGIPNSDTKFQLAVWTVLLGIVEGIILVATPALVRDFSPQLGRASAMGFWTLGPVVGSLVVSQVSSRTLVDHPDWQFQFRVCGVVGLVVWLLTFLCLRELAPRIRDQLMVSLQDRALIEARAKGLDLEAVLQRPWKRVLTPSIIASALGISVFLLGYYTAVAFFPIFFQTVQGFTADQANGLLNYYWSSNAIALIVVGALSDRLGVRKPFMLVGGVGAALFSILIYNRTTHTDTSYAAWAVILIGVGVYGGFAFATWMASFTETVEEKSPALIAHGLAVWGWLLRVVVAVSFLTLPLVIDSVTPLVEHGAAVKAAAERQHEFLPTVQANQEFLSGISQKYPKGGDTIPADVQTQIVETVGAPTATALASEEGSKDFGVLGLYGEQVLKAQSDSPKQWRRWFLICLLGQLLFIPLVFMLHGHWSPRRAREEAEEHERLVREEMERLHIPADA